MKIAIVVPGRFHAFDLALALERRGHEVVVLTNYPIWATRRFGLSRDSVRSCWIHGILFRLSWWAHDRWGTPFPEARLNRSFGRWAVRTLQRETWDVIHPWSALAEEILVAYQDSNVRIVLMRGSSHIRTQTRLLEEEEQRTGTNIDKPSPWVIEREEREYALAKHIIVLSSFAEKTFLAEGIPAAKLQRLLLTASVDRFRPSGEVIEERCRRLLSGQPLLVLYVGTLSYRKGLFDLATIMDALISEKFKFRIVGPMAREVKSVVERFASCVEFPGFRPENELPRWYAEADVFIFPTLEDGFALVLSQAVASCLPVIATEHSAAPDLALTTATVTTLPIRDPNAFIRRLRWCDQNRRALVDTIRTAHGLTQDRNWNDVAAEFELGINKD